MNKQLFLFLSTFVVFTTSAFSQTNNSLTTVPVKYLSVVTITEEITRPRIVEVKAPEVTVAEVRTPEVKAPEMRVADVKASEVNAPEVKAPEPKVAEVKASVIVNIGSVERIAFRMLNEKRAENGLKALMWSDDLERVARIHSQNMADFKFFSHQGIDGKMVSDRADCLGVGNWRSIGENIAFNRGYADPITKAVELWLDSPTHRHNLMDENWKESAVGVALAADGSYYFTQVFLLKK